MIYFRRSRYHVFPLLGTVSRPAFALHLRTGIRLLSGFKRMALYSEWLSVLLQHYRQSDTLQFDEHQIPPSIQTNDMLQNKTADEQNSNG